MEPKFPKKSMIRKA